jgi:hypothetical protein
LYHREGVFIKPGPKPWANERAAAALRGGAGQGGNMGKKKREALKKWIRSNGYKDSWWMILVFQVFGFIERVHLLFKFLMLKQQVNQLRRQNELLKTEGNYLATIKALKSHD